MSKIVLLCFRNNADKSVTLGDFDILSERLMPDNISANPPLVIERDGIILGILNPNPSLHINDTSICAGHMINPSPKWGEPLSPVPDGAYALFRSDEKTIELATDMLASRAIWYVQTESIFIASTSQRAIVFFLESFELNEVALVWMLSSGSLGSGNSWDRRIKFLTPDTRLRLDRRTWKVTFEKGEVDFHCTGRTEQEYERDLREALEYSFAGLSLDYSKWALALSGGYDSRGILLKLKEHRDLQCITCGMRSELSDKESDAFIARQLAGHFGLPHRYFELDPSDEPIEKVFGRFISAAEGRTDNISHSLDGLQMWKSLFDSNIQGIIRGDQVFGWPRGMPNAHHRQAVGAPTLKDFANLQAVRELAERQFGEQIIPDWLDRKSGESVATWSCRIYQEFRVPVHIAAWHEWKFPYLEVVQPFLSRRIVSTMRAMPDSLRAKKALFRQIVAADSPRIPCAKHGLACIDVLRTAEAVSLLSDSLNSSYFRGLFSNAIVDHILGKLRLEASAVIAQRFSLRNTAKLFLPESIQDFLRRKIKFRLSYSTLAFRMYLAGKANEMFTADANQLAIHKRRSPCSEPALGI